MRKAVFGVLLFLPLIFPLVGCRREVPHIDSIYPRIGAMGELITIRGQHFGEQRDESYVSIAGTAPTSSAYIEWGDTLISLRTPEFGQSGLVYVHRGDQKSNAALFSNQAAIPQPAPGNDNGGGPVILSISPNTGAIGSVITIQGSNFGSSREGSGVFFAWDAEALPSAPAEISGPSSVEVFEAEFGYELWSEREIRVRVPDGAISGSLEIRTSRGTSQGAFFEVSGRPGTKVFKDKRSYAISYAVDIQVRDASEDNALYLWIPQPVISASQRNIQLLSRNRDPFVENYRGTTLFKLNNLAANTGAGINQSYLVEVYSVETTVNPQQIRQSRNSAVEAAYTIAAPLIPSDNGEIKKQAAAITGREQNVYLKARLIYEWLIKNGGIQWQLNDGAGGAIEALETKQADPYMAALLFCSLARASGIPALPVSGVLIDRSPAASRHYWAEFWVEGLGWIPVDPALGAGAAPANFSIRQDRETYYFGSMDNQRITFSRGQASLSQMESRGRIAIRERDYALQNLWEEAVGGLESYSSLWSDVTITGVYAQ